MLGNLAEKIATSISRQMANQEIALLPHKRAKSYKTLWTLADIAKAAA